MFHNKVIYQTYNCKALQVGSTPLPTKQHKIDHKAWQVG